MMLFITGAEKVGAFIDLAGVKCGRLTVISRDSKSLNGRVRWMCRCECGKSSLVDGWFLRKGKTKSCGCSRTPLRGTEDLTGKRFGRLVAIKNVGKNKHGRPLWECICDCGKVMVVNSNAIKRGNTKSCGCLNVEKRGSSNRTHGMSRTKTYISWTAMKARCYDKSNKAYNRYGGRGIVICDRWLNSFENFLNDMGERPFRGATVERIDNAGSYSPDNCKWAGLTEQGRNKRNNKLITVNGETKTQSEWSQITGISQQEIYRRLKSGRKPCEAITVVSGRKKKR